MQNPKPSAAHERLIQQALMKIGRNVLCFQRVEAYLKIVTPYLVPTSGKNIDPPPLDIERLLADKKMLGVLVQRLKDGINVGENAAFELYLKSVVERRNELIHHFLSRHDASLVTEEKCRSVIQYLDEQYDFIQPIVSLVEDHVDTFVLALDLIDGASQLPT